MGLAASQARLLTITARKADCEFQSMMLSHQKIALSRDMEKISNQYQNSLNATKLVYDYYGSGDSDMALTYGLLMTPSTYNDYYPKLVTDAKNRVILNSAYASAVRAAGIPAEGLSGTPSSDVRNKFIECLANANIISTNKAASIQGITYNNGIGNGNTITATKGITEIDFDGLLDMLNATGSKYGGLGTGGARVGDNNLAGWERFYQQTDGGSVVKVSESGDNANASGGEITLGQLLSGNTEYYLSLLSRRGDELPVVETQYLQERIAGENGILSWMLDEFQKVLGGTSVSDTALQYAYNSVYDIFVPNNHLTNWVNSHNGSQGSVDNIINADKGDRQQVLEPENSDLLGYLKEVGQYQETGKFQEHDDGITAKSSDYLGFYFTGDTNQAWNHKDRNDKSQVSVNLNNIAQVFLTAYVQYMEGVDTSEYNWSKGKVSSSNLYDPKNDKDFKFSIVTESEIDNNDEQLYANFYDTLFNRICLSGWTENDRIDDEEYMGEMFKSGMAYISSISDDGYYYQGNFSTDKAILEVKDDEAIAKAQAKYNTEKAKIENKEQTIDMKMKNLDTEITSLTTEYDSTKQVITKSVEKSFKRYEA